MSKKKGLSKPLNTHHHYGAQQVGTLKVDPISERINPGFKARQRVPLWKETRR